MRALIYVAGPLTKGDFQDNVRNAAALGNAIAELGHTPFVPHLHYPSWDLMHPHKYDFWMSLCLDMVRRSDLVLRIIPGESPGADRETELANNLGKQVEYLQVSAREKLRRICADWRSRPEPESPLPIPVTECSRCHKSLQDSSDYTLMERVRWARKFFDGGQRASRALAPGAHVVDALCPACAVAIEMTRRNAADGGELAEDWGTEKPHFSGEFLRAAGAEEALQKAKDEASWWQQKHAEDCGSIADQLHRRTKQLREAEGRIELLRFELGHQEKTK